MRLFTLCTAVVALLPAAPVAAQDALSGMRLYFDAGRIRGAGQSCVGCHFALPGTFGISAAANDPGRIERAVARIPQMAIFRDRLSATDYADLAAYIGRPDVPSPSLIISTGAGANDRIDFGTVAVGGTASGQMRLTNAGVLPLRLSSAPRLAGEHPLDFVLGASTCSNGLELAPQAVCTIDVRFAPPPGADGARRAALQVEHDWIGGLAAVALLGQAQPQGNPVAPPLGGAAGSSGGGGAVSGLAVAAAVLLGWARRRRRVPH
jgi:hypothetical protein